MVIRRRWPWFGAGLALLAVTLLPAFAQDPSDPSTRTIERAPRPEDKEDTWTLDFKFKNPRILKARIPGRQGERMIVYLWYQVINFTEKPRTFFPSFELVTLDRNTRHTDEVLPSVQKMIADLEDPTGRLQIKNSVTISEEPIPRSQPDAFPKAVTGVAIWTDVLGIEGKAPDTTRFSIFVGGLSNGTAEVMVLKDGKEEVLKDVIKYKTLQLNFKRLADSRNFDSSTITFVDNPEWIYRSVSLTNDDAKEPEKKDGALRDGLPMDPRVPVRP